MLEKKRILKSVEVVVTGGLANVCWVDQITEDGTVISEIPHRASYGPGQKDEFLTDVEGADGYLAVLGW